MTPYKHFSIWSLFYVRNRKKKIIVYVEMINSSFGIYDKIHQHVSKITV